MLNSCRHASLCEECCQRCDICPICRVPVPKSGAKTHLRLFYECVEAGLIPKNSKEKPLVGDGENKITTDVQRLYSLFDVALENNLVSLICHCILCSLSLLSTWEALSNLTKLQVFLNRCAYHLTLLTCVMFEFSSYCADLPIILMLKFMNSFTISSQMLRTFVWMRVLYQAIL